MVAEAEDEMLMILYRCRPREDLTQPHEKGRDSEAD